MILLLALLQHLLIHPPDCYSHWLVVYPFRRYRLVTAFFAEVSHPLFGFKNCTSIKSLNESAPASSLSKTLPLVKFLGIITELEDWRMGGFEGVIYPHWRGCHTRSFLDERHTINWYFVSFDNGGSSINKSNTNGLQHAPTKCSN